MKSILYLFILSFSFANVALAQVNNVKYRDGDLVPINMDYGNNDVRQIMAEVQGDFLVIEGDIIVSKLEDYLSKSAAILSNSSGRWPNSTIPYTIDPSLTDLNRITLAINHINDNTNLCIVPRATETDYITFVPSNGCSSYIGRIGGQQNINLASGCQWIETVHEILHAAGFYHEQSRADRDSYITVHYDNILTGFEGNFNKYSSGQDIGSYDYGSIMHYLHYFFGCKSCNGVTDCNPASTQSGCSTLSTLTRPNGSINFGPDYTNGMSATDILGVNTLYPTSVSCGCDVEFTGDDYICSGETGNLVFNITNAVGPFNITYSDGTSNFSVNGYISGNNVPVSLSTNTTYSIVSIIDSGDGNRECVSNETHVIDVLSEPGIAFSNGSNSDLNLSCQSVNSNSFTANSVDLKNNGHIIGWFFSDDDPSSTTSASGINNLIDNANNSSSLNLSTGNVIQSNSGNPLISLNNLSIDCNTLNGQNGDDEYYLTPFVATGDSEINCLANANSTSLTWSNGAGGEVVRVNPPSCSVGAFELDDVNIVLTVNSCSGASSTIGGDIRFNCGGSLGISSPFDFTFNCSGSTTVIITKAMLDVEKGSAYDPLSDQVCITFINNNFSGSLNLDISAALTATYSGQDAISQWNLNGAPVINENAGPCFWGTPIQLNCACCSINSVSTGGASCNGDNATFDITGFTSSGTSGNFQVVDSGNNVVGSGTSSPITVTVSGPTSSGSQNFRVRDAANNSCISTAVSVNIPQCPCAITGVTAGTATCNGNDATFQITAFTPISASGNYQVVDSGNNVVGSGTSAPITVTVSGPTASGSQNFRVRDAADNSCISTAVSVSIPQCPPCSITGVAAGSATCTGQDATFDITSFTAVNGSGSYEVIDINSVIVGTGASASITSIYKGPTTAVNQDFRVRDANAPTCISDPVTVSIPTCMLPCNATAGSNITGTITAEDTMRAKTYLTTDANVTSGSLMLQARDSVVLNQNFEVDVSGAFQVQIGDCDDN